SYQPTKPAVLGFGSAAQSAPELPRSAGCRLPQAVPGVRRQSGALPRTAALPAVFGCNRGCLEPHYEYLSRSRFQSAKALLSGLVFSGKLYDLEVYLRHHLGAWGIRKLTAGL